MNAPPSTIRLSIGQAVAWPASPTGFAQVEDLHRTKVTVGYRRGGKWKRARVHARRLAAEPMLFELDNPFGRGRVRRAKEFGIEGATHDDAREETTPTPAQVSDAAGREDQVRQAPPRPAKAIRAHGRDVGSRLVS